MLRFLVAAAALMSAPAAFAQQSQSLQSQDSAPEASETPTVYLAGGLAWSGELGLEFEAGVQLDVGDALRLRFSPANISLFDGQLPPGFFRDDTTSRRTCRYIDTSQATFDDECRPEVDSEWRTVVEGQFRLAEGFYIGGGATYLLQGDFERGKGRGNTFASFAWEDETGSSLEVRAGDQYVALQVRGAW